MSKRSAGRAPASASSTDPSVPPDAGPSVPPEAGRAEQPPDDGRRSRWVDHRRQRRDELVTMAVHAILTHGPDVDMAQIAAVA